jgi:hypothetical protein
MAQNPRVEESVRLNIHSIEARQVKVPEFILRLRNGVIRLRLDDWRQVDQLDR